MKYLNYLLSQTKKFLKGVFIHFIGIIIIAFIFVCMGISYYNEDNSLNPNDYCNLTDVEYKAVLNDEMFGNSNVKITEYLTFDVHAASRDNPFRELWRELPEEEVDGLTVTYDVESVTQILPDGTEVPYTQTNKMYWEDYDYTESSTYYWHHSDGSGRYPDNDESLLIYIPWTYRDKLKFKIEYKMNNAALKYNDSSELYLSMYSGNSIKKLNSFKADILIPKEKMPSTYYAYTFGTSYDRIPFSESDSTNLGYHTFSIDLNKDDLKFNRHNRYLEFCLVAYGKDKRIFTQYAPNNLYSNDNVLDELISENNYYTTLNARYRVYKLTLFFASLIISIIVIYFTKKKYNDLKNKYPKYEASTNYSIYKDIPSDLDPMFASELVFVKDPFNGDKEKGEEYAAILLSLVRKKYVTLSKRNDIIDWDDGNTVITLLPTQTNQITTENSTSYEPVYTTVDQTTGMTLEPLTTSERLYLELLEKYARISNNQITLAQLQMMIDGDYENTKAFINDIEKKPALENGVMLGYFQDTEYDKQRKNFINSSNVSVGIAITLIIVGIISYFTPIGIAYGSYFIVAAVLIWKYLFDKEKADEFILFTQFGADEQAKWKGLYNYLKSDEFKNDKNYMDPNLLEKYLIYATAFGISENVINSIKFRVNNPEIENSPLLNRRFYIHSRRFHYTSRSFGHAIHTTSRGGGFGGHGYGGGGRGGGGGGGGH